MSSNQEIQQQLEHHYQRLREINQDIEEARQRQHDLGELYRARTRHEEKIEALEEEKRRGHHKRHRVHRVLYDNYSIVSTGVVGRQSDSALQIVQPDPSNGGVDTYYKQQNTPHHGSHQ